MKRLLIIACLALCSCTVQQSVVAPKPIVSTQASYDGNQQSSGLVGPDGRGGFWVTPHLIDRYDALLAKYGARLSVPTKAGDRRGIETPAEGNNYRVTAEMMANFRRMNLWRKADPTP